MGVVCGIISGDSSLARKINKKLPGRSLESFLSDIQSEAFGHNIERVRGLISIYRNKLSPSGGGRRPVHATDVLRAASVLLHAALEDMLRGIASFYVANNANPEILNRIPLVGYGENGRSEKFFLGALAAHKNKEVKELIKDSVKSYYYGFATFNNTKDIANVLQACGIAPSVVETFFPELDEMIQRRHDIVHHADREERRRLASADSGQGTNRGYQVARSLSVAKVEHWIRTTERFAHTLYDYISNGKYSGTTQQNQKKINEATDKSI